jgi:hypothetical protein
MALKLIDVMLVVGGSSIGKIDSPLIRCEVGEKGTTFRMTWNPGRMWRIKLKKISGS